MPSPARAAPLRVTRVPPPAAWAPPSGHPAAWAQVRSAAWLKELKEQQLPAVFAARGLEVNELRPELASLRQQFELADHTRCMLDERHQAQLAGYDSSPAAAKLLSGKKRPKEDPLSRLLRDFCAPRQVRLEALAEAIRSVDAEVRETATWLAEPKSASVESLLVPIASFITSLEKEQVCGTRARVRVRARARQRQRPRPRPRPPPRARPPPLLAAT